MAESEGSSGDSFASLFEQSAQPKRQQELRVGQRISGVVIQVGRDAVFVELDGKRQAFLEAEEVAGPDGTIALAVGDTVQAQVIAIDDASGSVRLGKTMGAPKNLAALEQAKDSALPVSGKITGTNKGGLEVDLGGTRAFCPLSQSGLPKGDDPKVLVGQEFRFLITEIRDGGKSVVVSRRALSDREAGAVAETTLRELTIGGTRKGTVTAVRDFGAFVDLGGIEGLVPRSEVSYDRGAQIADVLRPGETVEVQILEVKDAVDSKGRPQKKITLSLKALLPEPEGVQRARAVVSGLAINAVVTAVVEKIETYGIFVQVEGTEGRAGRGLIPNVELGIPRGADVRKAFPEGTKVTAKVLETGENRLKLSIRGAKEQEERQEFDKVKANSKSNQSLGTLGDLLKNFQAKK